MVLSSKFLAASSTDVRFFNLLGLSRLPCGNPVGLFLVSFQHTHSCKAFLTHAALVNDFLGVHVHHMFIAVRLTTKRPFTKQTINMRSTQISTVVILNMTS